MALEVYVTNSNLEDASKINIDGEEILPTLGAQDEAVAVQLQELFTSVTQAISASIEIESELKLEITGSINLKAEGKTKYLFFNLGAEASASGTMKATLTTKLKPKIEINTANTTKNHQD